MQHKSMGNQKAPIQWPLEREIFASHKVQKRWKLVNCDSNMKDSIQHKMMVKFSTDKHGAKH